MCAAALVALAQIKRRQVWPFVVGAAICLLFAAFGAVSATVGTLQPNRFVAPGFLMLGIGAAFGIAEAALWLRAHAPRQVAWGAAEATPGTHAHYGKPGSELSRIPAPVAELMAWLRAETSDESRVLFESRSGQLPVRSSMGSWRAAWPC